MCVRTRAAVAGPLLPDVFLRNTRMPNLGTQRIYQPQLAQVRRHDVGHHLRLAHRRNHRLRRMPEWQHAVAAGIVDHGALESDDPRPARGQRDVRIHRIIGIEIDEAGLHRVQLRILVHRQQAGELRIGLQREECLVRGFDRFAQFRMAGHEARDGRVVEPTTADAAADTAQAVEHLRMRRARGVDLGWAHRGHCASPGLGC